MMKRRETETGIDIEIPGTERIWLWNWESYGELEKGGGDWEPPSSSCSPPIFYDDSPRMMMLMPPSLPFHLPHNTTLTPHWQVTMSLSSCFCVATANECNGFSLRWKWKWKWNEIGSRPLRSHFPMSWRKTHRCLVLTHPLRTSYWLQLIIPLYCIFAHPFGQFVQCIILIAFFLILSFHPVLSFAYLNL